MKWRNKVGAAIACCALLTMPAIASSVGSGGRAPGLVGQVGRWFVDSEGRVIVPHGFNVVAKLAPYQPATVGFNDDDAAFLARQGFTAVRLGVNVKGLEPTAGHYDDRYLSSIAATVQMLRRHGIYSLLDFHQDLYSDRFGGEGMPDWMVLDDGLPAQPNAGFPGSYFVMPALNRAFDNFWANAPDARGIGLQDDYAAAWVRVARRFRDEPGILGYDLFNEPWPGTPWATCFPPQGCPVFDGQLTAFSLRVIHAIRTVDSRHVTVYEPALPFDYSAPSYLGAIRDAHSALGFHAYCLAAVGAPETPPTRAVCNVAETRVFSNAQAQQTTSGHALVLSEFGATSDLAELAEVTSLADDQRVPWLEWAYCACGDPTGSGQAESLVYDPAKPPVGANINLPVLRALARAYPQAVAGVPLSFSFDPVTRAFRLTYTTRPVGGGRFGADVRTDIAVPPVTYPNGYRAVVVGGRAVSRAGAPVLSIVANPGATSVEVRVFPTQ